MIAYEELVAALTAWRARQGLPVAQGAAAAPAGRGRAPAATPPAPPRVAPPPAASLGEFDAGALVEDASDDYMMQLGPFDASNEPTAIGAKPEAMASARRGKRSEGW